MKRWGDEKTDANQISTHLADLLLKIPLLPKRIMYGTDWMALYREPDNQNYYSKMRDYFAALLKNKSDLNDFFGGNAVRFFGLHAGNNTRNRLDAFFQRTGQDPLNFDQYLN